MELLNDFFSIDKQIDTGDVTTFRICLNPEHIIYQVHFPNLPITPGVCIIQMVTECLERVVGKKLQLKRVKNIKFLTVLSPKDTLQADISFRKIEQTESGCRVNVILSSAIAQYAKISLEYIYA